VTGLIAACLALLARVASEPSVYMAKNQVCRRQCIFFATAAFWPNGSFEQSWLTAPEPGTVAGTS
jgi:hypothetical protein